MKIKFYEMLEKAQSDYDVYVIYDAENEAYRVQDTESAYNLGQLIANEYSGDEPLSHLTWVHNNYLYIKPA